MRRRATARLLAALVFALAAFGATGHGSFPVRYSSQTAVSARQTARREQRQLPEHSECAAPARGERKKIRVTVAPRITIWLPESSFQRPPPLPSPVLA